MEDLSSGFYLGFVIFAIARLLILISCILLVRKFKGTGTILMLAGVVVSVVVSIGRQLSHVLLDFSDPKEIVHTQGIISMLDGTAEIILGIGLILFVIQLGRERKNIPI